MYGNVQTYNSYTISIILVDEAHSMSHKSMIIFEFNVKMNIRI